MKYAIFRNKIGLYEWRYIDKPEDLKPYPYISASDLPVVVNSRGGYHPFRKENEIGFVEIREVKEQDEPLTREERYPKNSKEFEYGWIDLDGNTYNSGYEGHYDCAYYLCKELGLSTSMCESTLEEMGYVKITRLDFKTSVFATNLKLSKKQADTLYDLGLYDNPDVIRLVKYNENTW